MTTTGANASLGTGPNTIDWLNGIKGACMVLVVVLHISAWYYVAELGPGPWFDISLDLTPLRMPTFFLVSGVLAKNAIDNDWPKARRRSANLYFVYLLWTTIISLRLFVPAARGDGPSPTWALLGANAIVPAYYWYIWALPVYYLVSVGLRRLTGRAAPWLLVPAAALSFFAHDLNNVFAPYYPRVLEIMWTTETMQNFLWFYLGIVAKDWIVATFDNAKRRALLAAFVGALVYVIALRLTGLVPHSITPVGGTGRLMQMLETLGYMVMMLSFFVLLRNTRFTQFFNWIGRGTLPVYIFHWFFIMAMTVSLMIVLPDPDLPAWLAWIAPIVLAVLVSTAARLIGSVITKTPLRWVLNGPFPLSQFRRRTTAVPETSSPEAETPQEVSAAALPDDDGAKDTVR